jgi:DNA-binding transcriptional regulator YiaG
MGLPDLERLVAVRARCRTGEAAQLRTAAGLSQSDVARTLGVSPAAINRWERGPRSPSGTAALRYASLLEMLERANERELAS